MRPVDTAQDGGPTTLLTGKPWNALSKESIENILSAASEHILSRGEHVTAHLGIVLSGVVGVVQETTDGRRVYSALFHENHLVDLRCSARKPNGTLTALTPTRLLTLDAGKLDLSAPERADIANAMIEQLRAHCARMRDHCTSLACKTPLERLASALLEFHSWPCSKANGESGDSVRLPIRKSDLADYIGVKPETISRSMRRLEKEDLIAFSEGDLIDLLNKDALNVVANGGRPRKSTRQG